MGLPFDIQDEIVSHLPLPALRVCCLASSQLRSICLPYLFRDIQLRSGLPIPKPEEPDDERELEYFSDFYTLLEDEQAGHSPSPALVPSITSLSDPSLITYLGGESSFVPEHQTAASSSSTVNPDLFFESNSDIEGPGFAEISNISTSWGPQLLSSPPSDGPRGLETIEEPSIPYSPSSDSSGDDASISSQESSNLSSESFRRRSIECQRLRQVIENFPELGRHVKSLHLIQRPWTHFLSYDGTDYWICEEEEDLIFLLSHFPNLTRLAFQRVIPINYSGHNLHWKKIPLNLRRAIRRVLRLPSLETVDLTYGFSFKNPAEFWSEFDLGPTSNIKKLSISCMLFDDATVPAHSGKWGKPPAKLDFLELNYLGSQIEGPQLIDALCHPSCPFDVRYLKELVIQGINDEDNWITDLLQFQKDPERLTALSLHGIFRLSGPLPFISVLKRHNSINSLRISAELQTDPEGQYFYEWLSSLPVYPHLESLHITTCCYGYNPGRSFEHLEKVDEFISPLSRTPKLKTVEIELLFEDFSLSEGSEEMTDEKREASLRGMFPECERRGILKISRVESEPVFYNLHM